MKLRLRIATSPDSATTFEHAGPVVRIGRGSECELALQGDASKAVSREHARIELTLQGATVADAGSSNGTLLNDRLIEQPQPLRAGDRIQLGYTGATLTVVELDLAPTRAAGPDLKTLGIGAAIVAACLVMLGGAFALVMSFGKGKPTAIAHNTDSPRDQTFDKDRDRTIADKEPTKDKDKAALPPPPPVIEVGLKDGLSAEQREVGRYVSVAQWGPSVLLQRQGEVYPWTPLRPEGKVSTAQMLISLPGYRSVLALDSGVQLTLWGNVPEFSAFPPVLESAAMLNAPAPGVDLDVTLDHGRVHLANRKPSGPARVKLRFLREAWELTLPDGKSEVCAELWALPRRAGTAAAPALCLGLFTKGAATLETPRKLDLGDRTRLTWLGPDGSLLGPVTQPQLPDWWAKPPDRGNPQVADAMLTLLDWSKELTRTNEVFDMILTRVRETKDPEQRVIGLLFLAALDGTPYVVDFLEDRPHPDVRGTAAHALRCRLARGADQPGDLARLLEGRRGYAREKAALVVQLLQNFSEEAIARPETYQELIAYLDHENLAVRDLAYWHLVLLASEGAKKIKYDSTADAAARQQAIAEWKKLLPPGQLPPRRPAG